MDIKFEDFVNPTTIEDCMLRVKEGYKCENSPVQTILYDCATAATYAVRMLTTEVNSCVYGFVQENEDYTFAVKTDGIIYNLTRHADGSFTQNVVCFPWSGLTLSGECSHAYKGGRVLNILFESLVQLTNPAHPESWLRSAAIGGRVLAIVKTCRQLSDKK